MNALLRTQTAKAWHIAGAHLSHRLYPRGVYLPLGLGLTIAVMRSWWHLSLACLWLTWAFMLGVLWFWAMAFTWTTLGATWLYHSAQKQIA